MTEFNINTNQNFSFFSTIYSHGWSDLLPFNIDPKNKILSYAFEINPGKNILPEISSDGNNNLNVKIISDSNNKDIIISKIRRIFRLDDDLSEFYQIAEQDKQFKWVIEKGAGRLLRCSSLWEDMVKMLCTTNCTWRLTQIMTENLYKKLGRNQSFPSAEVVSKCSEQYLREEIKMGYRAPYLLQFAQDVTLGKLNLTDFENWDSDSLSLYKEIRKIKGFGDYAVSSLMKLLGRYDFMGFDSWNRKQFITIHKQGKTCSDEQITKFYKKFGKWAGLFFWLDVTKEWYFRENPWE